MIILYFCVLLEFNIKAVDIRTENAETSNAVTKFKHFKHKKTNAKENNKL